MRFVLFTFCLHFLLRRHVYFFGDLVPWLSFSKFLSSPAPPFSSTSTRFFLVCSRTLVMSFFLRYTSSDSLFSNFSPSNFFRKKFDCLRRDGSKPKGLHLSYTPHLNGKKLSTNSSWDFEHVFETMDDY